MKTVTCSKSYSQCDGLESDGGLNWPDLVSVLMTVGHCVTLSEGYSFPLAGTQLPAFSPHWEKRSRAHTCCMFRPSEIQGSIFSTGEVSGTPFCSIF